MTETTTPHEPTFEERLAALKVAFVRALGPRADGIEEHARALMRPAPDVADFAELRRAVHNLVGTSGVHGIDEVSAAGRAMLARLDAKAANDPVHAWAETVALLEVMRRAAAAASATD